MSGLRAISYGGGVQSTALLVLAAERKIDFPVFLFSNVGDDSEDPETLVYIEKYAVPYAAANGIELYELRKVRRDGTTQTLYRQLTRDGSQSVPIPVYINNGMPGKRACTADYKIRVVAKWLKAHGATEANPATVGIGISLDEIHRVNGRRAQSYEIPVYPLLDHEPPLRRSDCEQIILAAGLPVPPKSSCWFCPFHRPQVWAEMRRDRPELFKKACGLESLINGRRDERAKDRVYLTRLGKPLADAIPEAQDMLPDFDPADDATCDNGACFT